jgi:hypothetical protein
VIAETLTKDFSYSDQFKKEMEANKISEKSLKDDIISKGKIDFDKSNAQKKPCPEYILNYPKDNPTYEIHYSKCKEKAEFIGLKKLK